MEKLYIYYTVKDGIKLFYIDIEELIDSCYELLSIEECDFELKPNVTYVFKEGQFEYNKLLRRPVKIL